MSPLTIATLTRLRQSIGVVLYRQISFPTPLRALAEVAMFAGVFAAAGKISLGVSIEQMAWPLVVVVAVMMLSMVVSGVYRADITHSIMNIYVHSAYGFFIATVMFLLIVALFMPTYADGKFVFFFLFFSFFVMNTIRPLITGTDFMDGGGRRTN
ncbi:MAG: hypothetical protein V3U65_07985 [Granulosicoccaceae bacterium]